MIATVLAIAMLVDMLVDLIVRFLTTRFLRRLSWLPRRLLLDLPIR